MRILNPVILLISFVLLSCGGSSQGSRSPHHGYYYKAKKPKATKPPKWIKGIVVEKDRLCGFGVAGAGFDENSPYPKRLSKERAVLNLAGIIETKVQESIIDRQTTRSSSVQLARALTIDEALIEKVKNMVETEYWLDVNGKGPYASKMFTYAHACMDAKIAAKTFKIESKTLTPPKKKVVKKTSDIPKWINNHGKQPGGRLCAVGFSLPMFHADKTFQGVVEDIRSQLAEVLQTFVSSYYEELSTTKGSAFEAMTMANTQAVSKGAIVTHYWYDRKGIGPHKRPRSTYGWGCIYPVDVLRATMAQVEAQAPPQEKKIIEKVRERATAAFADLDQEIEKREQTSPAPSPEKVTPKEVPQEPHMKLKEPEPTKPVENEPNLTEVKE